MPPTALARRRLVLATTTAWLTSACRDRQVTQAQAPSTGIEGPLIVGVVAPETGEEAAFGSSIVAGVLAAAGRFNARGGVQGRAIEVVHLDDGSDTQRATSIVKDLIARKSVAIFAAPTGASTFAPLHLVNESKTVFVSIGSRRHLKASGPFVFRHAVPDDLAADDLISHAVREAGYTRVALVTSADEDFSLDLSAAFRRALAKHGAAIAVQADSYDSLRGTRDLPSVVSALQRAAPPLHSVVFTGGAGQALQLAQQMRDAGLRLPLIGGEDFLDETLLQGGEAIEHALLYGTFSTLRHTPRTAEFLADLGPVKPDRFSALAYDTFMLVAEAIRTAGSTDASRIHAAILARNDFEGATGATRFAADNTPIKHPMLFEVRRSSDGALAFSPMAGSTTSVPSTKR